MAGTVGMMVGDALTSLQPGQLSKGFKTGWDIILALSRAKVTPAVVSTQAPELASTPKPDDSKPGGQQSNGSSIQEPTRSIEST